MRANLSTDRIDWATVGLYAVMVFLGWASIYAAIYSEDDATNLFNLSQNPGKQLLWIGTSIILIIGVMSVDHKVYSSFGYVFYGVAMLLLVIVLGAGTVVSGSKSWIAIGGFRLQPSEFAKFATAMALATYLSDINIKMDKLKTQIIGSAIIGLPMLLILLQGDMGSAMVFGSFFIVMFREGMSPVYFVIGFAFVFLFVLTLIVPSWILYVAILAITSIYLGVTLSKESKKDLFSKVMIGVIAGLISVGTVASVDFILNKVLKPHQRNRMISLVNPDIDPLGVGWNVTQSKIAIGSGGFWGKGHLQGTQTKFDFVPEQSTDFIFCTIGEEHGWIGSIVLIGLFVALLVRVSILAERQKSRFARIYGYGAISVIFFHFAVNIAMTIGLFPVIGIPLPFFSYGGSSLWSFTILLFIMIKLDSERMNMLMR